MWLPREDDPAGYNPELVRRPFRDRADAGAKLAAALSSYAICHPLIIGIPRGGVPVAYQVAKELDAELDVIVARKITAPSQPELAIGAVTADGTTFTNAQVRALSGLSEDALTSLTLAHRADAHERQQSFRAGMPPVRPGGRVVIVVDDGLATGATMMAALRSLRRAGAERVVVAVPVASAEACARIAREVDEVVCLLQPAHFDVVSDYYENFHQTADAEVQRFLIKQRKRRMQKTRRRGAE
ncbi:MAG TPA: phosphoribosyltransferase family protein [Polyangiales bacterium]|jgi:predicted phosphoribosyltransferase|nr:phosphoribosyltransferase family protein [Polyangiales bacterium]